MAAVSVLIGVYNGERFLAETIRSVLVQTFADFELVIVDDGSTDATPEIVRDFKDPRIRYVAAEHAGVAAAANLGLQLCRTGLVARLDADDLMEPNRLERQLAFFGQHPELGGVASYHWWIDEKGVIGGAHDPPLHTLDDIERHIDGGGRLMYPSPTLMLRRDVVLDLGGYDPAFDFVEDVELCVRMYEAGFPILIQPERLVRFRVHSGSITANHAREQFYRLEAIFGNLRRRRKGLSTLPPESYREAIQRTFLSRLVAEAKIASGRLRRTRLQQAMRGRHATAGLALMAAALLDPRGSVARLRRDARRNGARLRLAVAARGGRVTSG